MIAIAAEGVSKQFRRQTVQPHTTLKSALVNLVRRRDRSDEEGMFQALREITFTVQQGQVLGIIGRNGSGKSTLLKLLVGIYRPDRGKMHVYGKVGALLELGAGFHPEFSGRENVLINGMVLGLSKREVRQRFDAIVRFAELEGCIDEPVKTYSSGMYMRLGFAVAVHAAPDILLIDEILAVGDETFQQKCFDKLAAFRRLGKTIVLVSHDLATVERWSDKALWLDKGIIQERGTPRRVIDRYREGLLAQEEKAALAEHQRITRDARRRPRREVLVEQVQDLELQGEVRAVLEPERLRKVQVRVGVELHPAQVARCVNLNRHALVADRRRLEVAVEGLERDAGRGSPRKHVRALHLELHRTAGADEAVRRALFAIHAIRAALLGKAHEEAIPKARDVRAVAVRL